MYFIQFRYKQDDVAWVKSRERAKLPFKAVGDLHHNNVTICEILRGPKGCSTKDMVTFFKGSAECAAMDCCSKNMGRKWALTHALQAKKAIGELIPNYFILPQEYLSKAKQELKSFRTLVWSTYLSRKNLPALREKILRKYEVEHSRNSF